MLTFSGWRFLLSVVDLEYATSSFLLLHTPFYRSPSSSERGHLATICPDCKTLWASTRLIVSRERVCRRARRRRRRRRGVGDPLDDRRRGRRLMSSSGTSELSFVCCWVTGSCDCGQVFWRDAKVLDFIAHLCPDVHLNSTASDRGVRRAVYRSRTS